MLLRDDGEPVTDDFVRPRSGVPADPLPPGDWLLRREDWEAAGRPWPETGRLGLELEGQDSPEGLEDVLSELALIVVRFPVATDGRGFSLLPWLRRLGYSGPVRAAGDLRVDQLSALRRTGFNSFELAAGVDLAVARDCLRRFGRHGVPA
ncbi:DUF934 domain-containing protein [Alkalilimnicola ehrlichii MLHE-1]|uniref:Uncharacterized conserved protein UCP030820 n=1 Tax=Alkalilimnicola ehrlichii (strain ATCC BAA-1101 / DSM 17681 / MLHE-1) TaxID=187272 RepID=Q0A973_ALKEH|nr:DUF934 domain-containing protein [Alkalilimnicola ehrlichii]ABI56614.1 Uncharacterized conserved protein UCP030820 [Alkalilimnicola ehrlichii MLHE-1]